MTEVVWSWGEGCLVEVGRLADNWIWVRHEPENRFLWGGHKDLRLLIRSAQDIYQSQIPEEVEAALA